jgi:hypothetical protein
MNALLRLPKYRDFTIGVFLVQFIHPAHFVKIAISPLRLLRFQNIESLYSFNKGQIWQIFCYFMLKWEGLFL